MLSLLVSSHPHRSGRHLIANDVQGAHPPIVPIRTAAGVI